MTVAHIGNTVWDQHTGALTPPQTGIERKQRNDGSVKLKATARRAEPHGQITTTKTVRYESDAVLLAQLAGLMQGRRVAVALAGAVFTGVRVDGVEVTWPKVRAPDQRTFLVTARWSFGPTSPDNHDDPKDRLVPAKVETCRVWGEWVERKHLHATSCTNVFGPFGTVIGNALAIQTLDPEAVDEDGEPDTEARTLADVLGHYVRISVPEGTPEEVAVATAFTTHWHGRIVQRSIGDDRGRVTAGFTCLDLSTLFGVWLSSWYELNDDGIVADGTEIGPFNAMPSGERSSGTPGPDDTYVHDLTRTVGLEWRNGHIADLIIAAYNAQFPDGPRVALAGQLTALDNFQAHDLDGSNVQEMLGQLICRGIGCRVLVVDDVVTLHLNTGVQAALTAGAWTVPANDRQTTVDLHDLDDLVGWNLDEDISQIADRILYRLGLPWYCGSFGISDADDQEFRKTWSGADETAWDDLNEKQRDNADQSHIWRRFLLDKGWVGSTYLASPFTINVGRTTVTNATHGTGGENGEFSDTGNDRFPWARVRFTKSLPITVGDDWTADMSSGGPGVKPNRALERPAVYSVTDPGGDETWTRLDMQVVIDDDYPAIILGKDAADALIIRDLLQDGAHLVVTIGFRVPRPWRVSWRRDPAERLSDQERVVEYQRPDFDYRYLMTGTVVGVDDDDQPKVQEAGGVIGAKSTIPIQLLGIGRLSHEHPQRGLTWTRQRIDLTAATTPGAFITTAAVPYGEDADPDDDEGPETERTVNAPIGVHSINLDRANPSTTWSTTRLAADVVLRPKPSGPRPTITDLAAMVYTA